MTIFFTGDSHCGALRGGVVALLERGEIAEDGLLVVPIGPGNVLAEPFFVDAGDHLRIVHEQARGGVRQLPLPRNDVTAYGITGPLHATRVYRHPDWVSYALLADDCDAIPVSAALFRQVVLDDQLYILNMLRALQRLGLPVFVVEAPRPFRHHPAVTQIGAQRVLAIDRLYRGIIRSELDAIGILVVDVPPETLDDDGFTRDEFRSLLEGDVHHANGAFGALLLARVLEKLPPQWRGA